MATRGLALAFYCRKAARTKRRDNAKRQTLTSRQPSDLANEIHEQRRRRHVWQALASRLWRAHSSRDRRTSLRLGGRDARGRNAASCGEAGLPLLRPDADLRRHRPPITRLRRLSPARAQKRQG